MGGFAMRRRSRVGVIGVTLLCALLFSSSVYGEESLEPAPDQDVVKKVEEHNRKGIEYYKAGQLSEAVQEMLEAYHLIPSDDLLYNIARIYRPPALELGQKLARWSNDKRALLHDCDPMLPVGVINREADKWQPLFTIADIAGGVWPELAAQALLASSSTMSETKEVQLLVDIAKVLRMNNYQMEEGIFTSDLIEDLCDLEDSSWKDYNFRHRFAEERQIQPRQLSNLLKAFHLRPTSIRQGDLSKKGYKVAALKKVIDRYV